ncbi:tyrosine aminotransferase [Basidiobolus meristosporus CBS 931.73]|uniref:Tyrosine aminotransferase n=1 Tax=Basidiobolus meristosporus CBS 931.73 TaxID=1314790 RepID=A0A1Y1Y2T4_9FUNG|nr:tyrosine aminotransferase [Basidiobolus meristosporus CBS 931.73]|eukprot:ORX92331.1 tyrosine aminotransferase [Basidiobolus meristosporus CBS 931.73]
MTTGAEWNIRASKASQRAVNPIRRIVDNLKVAPHPQKAVISLALGDPTIFGNFKIDESCIEAVVSKFRAHTASGYGPSTGLEVARDAIAKKYGTKTSPLTANDVIIASGASGALELAIGALADEGQNILLPRPGFSVYETLAGPKKIECRYYNLSPENSWEIDIDHLKSLIDENTAAVIINNPSNPCGSVFSEAHLKELLRVCEEHRLPIISDEIYGDMVFSGYSFTPIASLTNSVPVISVGGLAKRYLVPGWRVGWVLIHDRNEILKEVREGLISLSQMIIGANTVIQAALPEILHNTPESFYTETNLQVEQNALLSEEMLSRIPGLRVIKPQGAMYMMVEIQSDQFKDIKDDVEFSEKLLGEESVIVLPAQCFKYPNYVRLVITPPKERLIEAYERIENFCHRHHI